MQRQLTDWGGNIAAFACVIAVNVLANALPLGGQTTGTVSAKYPTLFVPAGYVFSIWGLIYLGLLAFVIWQALPAQRNRADLGAIRYLFAGNCIANAAWLVAWHYDQLLLSLVLMVVILLTLVGIYRLLGIGNAAVAADTRWFVHVPFSLYTGWITVATIANLTAVQFALGWSSAGLTAVTWTLVKLAVAGVIAATLLFRRGDIAFTLVVAWASIGIAVKQSSTPEVAGAATTLAILAGMLAVLALVRGRRLYAPAIGPDGAA